VLRLRYLLLFMFASILAGCNSAPPQGTVHGKVTLNGEPAEGGLIRMVPVAGDSQPADCVIKPGGEYEITMPPGEKKVELTWRKNAGVVADTANQGTVPPSPQLFPPKYNSQTEERYTVKPGKEQKDFEIKVP
jgi:hypothetical protein